MPETTRRTRSAGWLATIHVAIFGDRRLTLPPDWTNETLVGIFGDTDVDASATSGAGASLTVVGVFADTTIQVPPGTRVRERGFSVFGDRNIQVSPGDGLHLRLNIYGFFSDLTVVEAQSHAATHEPSSTAATEAIGTPTPSPTLPVDSDVPVAPRSSS